MSNCCVKCFSSYGYLNNFNYCVNCEIEADEKIYFLYTDELYHCQLEDVYSYKNKLYFKEILIPY